MNRCTPLTLTLGLGNYPSQFQRMHSSTFRKSHQFDVINKTAMLSDGNKRASTGRLMFPAKSEPSLHPRSSYGLVPAWVVFEKQVLRFFAYFKETLPEVNRIPYQIRNVHLTYFLDDDTIQITEPRVDLGSQCLVSRQRIRKAGTFSDEHITLLDLNVDKKISLLDRIYHITDCDNFTRNFLNRLGICVPSPLEMPKDPATELRKMDRENIVAKHPTSKDYRFAKFLKNDRIVLRFNGYWDDTRSENGDIRILDILYHLSDDTFEIKEKLESNSGRSSNGMFLKRGKLPKHACNLRGIGEDSFTVLNVLGRDAMKGRFLKDRLDTKFGEDESKYYNETDLIIGQTINVYGRKVVLTNCDGRTQEFYNKKYGIEEFIPIPFPSKSFKITQTTTRPEFEYPPYNGFGSYEDSEGNCVGIEPKLHKIDFRKFLDYDKLILRFGAIMINNNVKENNDRLFVISYYLSDDTIAVYELACRNAGFRGGEFIGKSKIYLPCQEKFTSRRPIPYKSQDLFLGAIVNLRDYVFKITSADLFALKFMEDHKELYPMSNNNLILTKVKRKLYPIYKDFISRYMTKVKAFNEGEVIQEYIGYEDFKNMLRDLLQNEITEHEIVTLCRHFSIETKKSPRDFRELVRSFVQCEIYRELWSDIDRLKEFIYHLSPNNVDYLDEKNLMRVIKGCRVPLDNAIIEQLFAVLNRNENGEYEVGDFLNFIDLKAYRATPVPPINPKKNQFHFEVDEGSFINWNGFLSALNFEDDLKTSGD